MKVFQILNGFCHWDCTSQYGSAENAAKFFAPNMVFVDAPDYVFESWGFDETKEGDARFIKPTPPEGWEYDDATGTFYPSGELPPGQQPTEQDDINAMLVDHELRIMDLELGISEEGV